MANYNNLLSTINGAIKTNGTGAITGQLLQTILDGMVASLGAKYQYAGVATPSTNPGTPDENVFYLATQAGTYTNFRGLVVDDGEVCALKWDGTWVKEVTGAATAEQVSQLGQEYDTSTRQGFKNLFYTGTDAIDNIVFNTSGVKVQDNAYITLILSVNPGDLIVSRLLPTLIDIFGERLAQSDFIQYITPAQVFIVPNNCYWVTLSWYKPSTSVPYSPTYVEIVREVWRKPVGIYKVPQLASNINTGVISKNNNWTSCLFKITEGTPIRISSSKASAVDVDSFVVWYDESMNYISFVSTKTQKLIIPPTGAVFGNWCYYTTGTEIDSYTISQCIENIETIERNGPSFLEFARRDYNKDARAAFGMHGFGEANVCWNMDYSNGIHKYYDKTIAALWLALNSGALGVQYAPANLEDSGDNDIWANGGYLYAAYLNPAGQLIVGSNMNEVKGNACFSGNRQRVGGIDLAGLTECVIEGNRVMGTKGSVYLNSYNDGLVHIARGGGEVIFGGTEGAKANTPPASATAPGYKGEVRFCSDAIYVCIATNTWMKCALSVF